jgi:hypothetical protein
MKDDGSFSPGFQSLHHLPAVRSTAGFYLNDETIAEF